METASKRNVVQESKMAAMKVDPRVDAWTQTDSNHTKLQLKKEYENIQEYNAPREIIAAQPVAKRNYHEIRDANEPQEILNQIKNLERKLVEREKKLDNDFATRKAELDRIYSEEKKKLGDSSVKYSCKYYKLSRSLEKNKMKEIENLLKERDSYLNQQYEYLAQLREKYWATTQRKRITILKNRRWELQKLNEQAQSSLRFQKQMDIACPDACFLPAGYPKLPEPPCKPSPYVNVVKKRKDENFPPHLTQKIKNAMKGLELKFGKDYVDSIYPKKQVKPGKEEPKPATVVSADLPSQFSENDQRPASSSEIEDYSNFKSNLNEPLKPNTVRICGMFPGQYLLQMPNGQHEFASRESVPYLSNLGDNTTNEAPTENDENDGSEVPRQGRRFSTPSYAKK